MEDMPKPPLPDLSELFDLKRHKAVAAYVARFESLLEERQKIANDITELGNEIKEDAFTRLEVRAMQDIAKWRVNDTVLTAAAKLAALRRVANAVGDDLFTWAGE